MTSNDFAAVWRLGDGTQWVHWDMSENEFKQKDSEYFPQGLRITSLIIEEGRFAAVWQPGYGTQWVHWGMSESEFKQKDSEYFPRGLRITSLIIDEGRFAAVWQTGNGTQWVHFGTPTLSQGSQGEAVRKLQHLLNEHVPDLPSLAVDGDFGPATDARVQEYQRRVEITVDGVVGPQTWGMLSGGEQSEEAAAGTPTLQQGSHGPAVRKLQRLLNDHLPDLQLVVDGRFGPVTDGRVRKFQQRVDIAVDGIVGPQTWGRLTPQWVHWDMSENEFKQKDSEYFPQGLRITSLIIEEGRFAAVWQPGNGTQWVHWGMTENEFKQKDSEYFPQGLRITSLIIEEGRFAAVWQPGNGTQWVRWGMSENEFKDRDTFYFSARLRINPLSCARRHTPQSAAGGTLRFRSNLRDASGILRAHEGEVPASTEQPIPIGDIKFHGESISYEYRAVDETGTLRVKVGEVSVTANGRLQVGTAKFGGSFDGDKLTAKGYAEVTTARVDASFSVDSPVISAGGIGHAEGPAAHTGVEIGPDGIGAEAGASAGELGGQVSVSIGGKSYGLGGEIGLKAEVGIHWGTTSTIKLPVLTITGPNPLAGVTSFAVGAVSNLLQDPLGTAGDALNDILRAGEDAVDAIGGAIEDVGDALWDIFD
ncbi:peptidoglycan-binding protein [Streptomyces europaeiscabiei]|uniref:peptidoglycan-binding protein n=1 Tax=Streptomyces europaeiscabiei TaxID=146819 RepID=UPI0029A9C98B|nr:peptidoglycan-binding protein [Streptomyces europaeiscabiei]MDX3839526.1 peptidoglycan-binding protein [Streptomyces europaeiscabiei]